MKVKTALQFFILSLAELTLNPPEGIIAGPVSEENFFEWEALITYDDFYLKIYNSNSTHRIISVVRKELALRAVYLQQS